MPLTIASLPVAGGTLALSPMPGRCGSYSADLADLAAFAPALVITLTPLEELAPNATTLAADLAQHGLQWLHLPIVDFGTPQGQTARLWPAAAAQTLALLAAENRVLIHCMGGCGRSGMAALRLMVMAGEDPAAALIRLRQARPCAVETDAQQAWASRPVTKRSCAAPTFLQS